MASVSIRCFSEYTIPYTESRFAPAAHNDIKPSNIMLSSTNTPIFVDFGFAQKWDVNAIDTGANTLIGGLTTLTGHNASCHELFQSEISWGTPEYLDPQRAKGLRHDERASDVWALGVSLPGVSRSNSLSETVICLSRLPSLRSLSDEHLSKNRRTSSSAPPNSSPFITIGL